MLIITQLPKSRRTAIALAVLVSTAWTPVALTKEFPKVIPLSSLDGSIGFRFDGEVAEDNSGSSASTAGDVNGDGFSDVIVGGVGADPHGSISGSSYVVFGKASGFGATVELSSLDGTNGFRLDGVAAGDVTGFFVDTAGDVNGDGFDDVIVGAPDRYDAGPGTSYVVFGKVSGFPAHVDLSSLDGSNGFRLDGIGSSDLTGYSVGGAGDVNGDGFDDVIVGAPRTDAHGSGSGSSYVIFGTPKEFAARIKLSSLNGRNGFRLDGAAAGDYSSISVSNAGDVNGDGFADVIVGAWGADSHGTDSGSSYVVFGKASNFAAKINVSTLDGTNGFRIDGAATGDESGRSVADAGDVNGDGFDDVIIKAPRGNFATESCYVVFGKGSGFGPAIELSSLDGSTGFRLDGVAPSNFWGREVAGGGDVNGDGFADIVVGASHEGAGRSYVMFGKASGFASVIDLKALDGKTGFRLDGVTASDETGYSVASAGDFNGDGFADLIIGAQGTNWHGGNSGSSYVVFGRAPDTARKRIGSDADQYISGGPFADTLKGIGGHDTLEGRGGADNLIGGPFGDTASYQHAAAGVKASLANSENNTGDAQGDSYRSIRHLIGSRFADQLIGDSHFNRLAGGLGPDVLTGRGDLDRFVLSMTSDSPPGAGHDQVTDFEVGVDKIDLRAIDASTGPGNQRFTFIGTAIFHSVKGELRVEQSGNSALVTGDVNGDGNADFEIELLNTTASALSATDFKL